MRLFAPLLIVRRCLLLTTAILLQASTLYALSPDPQYNLAVSFDLNTKQLTGTARIDILPGEGLNLSVKGLEITAIVMEKNRGNMNEAYSEDRSVLTVPAEADERRLYISYTKSVGQSYTNRIEKDGIVLLQDWYPTPDKKVRYQLSAQLPENFQAVSQSEAFPLKREGNIISADTAEPIDILQLVAAPYERKSLQVREDFFIHALFYPEDLPLADRYLRKGRDYLLRYEKEIGPFPYNHFVIVANKLPTGYGMGSFTLIGQTVLRLPFIVDTSLGHEIVHAWFGNSVGVDYSQGNWCEGLTSYLADHAFRRDINEGSIYRKENIINFHSYIRDDTAIPLRQFQAASHSGLRGKEQRAVGYSRSLMLFHELNELIGDQAFKHGVRDLYSSFAGSEASWSDLEEVFEETSGKDLTVFFNERLSATDIPDIRIEEPEIRSTGKGFLLRFRAEQNSETPYTIKLPIRVTTALGHFYFHELLPEKSTLIELGLPQRPLSFTIDREYTMLRKLTPDELPSVWSRFLGSEQPLVILAAEKDRDTYQPILDRLSTTGWTVKLDREVANSELAQHDILFLGTHGASFRSLFADRHNMGEGFSLEVLPNPLNQEKVAVAVESTNRDESQAVSHRLSHYGKYSRLHFRNGRISEKIAKTGEAGITVVFEELPEGGLIQPPAPFEEVAGKLSQKDVIYVGEMHTSASDHRLQLRLIEAIAAKKAKVAIGMEMFPTSSQQALDNYTLSEHPAEEHVFLRRSGYFSNWSYDYRYFRDIFTLAQQKKIPVVGLNLERETVSSVFRTGSTDELSEEIQKSLPKDRDLMLPGYMERLSTMFSAHAGHASGRQSGFIQAQALWDESMATNIVDYLEAHPGTTMIVLAGNQHTRKDSGIPPRVARRLDVDQASVLNLIGDTIPINLAEVADYYFLSSTAALPKTGKVGVHLEELGEGEKKKLRINQILPHSKAGDAGLKEGDILVTINTIPITSMEDVRIAMLDTLPGETVQIKVLRDTSMHSSEVELVSPMVQKPPAHP